jgi:hypothetical protein
MSGIFQYYDAILQSDTYFIIKFSQSINIDIFCTYSFIDDYVQLIEATTQIISIAGTDNKEFIINSLDNGIHKFINGRTYTLRFTANNGMYNMNQITRVFLGKPSSPSLYYQTSFLNEIHLVATNPLGDTITEYIVNLYDVSGGDRTNQIYTNVYSPIIYDPIAEPDLDNKTCLFFEYYDASVNRFYDIEIIAKNPYSNSEITLQRVYTTNYSSPPKITGIQYLDEKVRVSFDWPTYTGGNNAEIYGISTIVTSLYSKNQLDDSRIIDISYSTVEINFSGLNYGREYMVQLYAENEAGNSIDASRIVIPKIKPSPPLIKNVDPRNRTIVVTYNIVPNSDICYIRYTLTNTTTGKIEIPQTDVFGIQGEDSTFTIECVKNNQEYMLTYRVINEVGISSPNYYLTTTYEDLSVYNKLKLRNSLNQPCALSQKQMYANRIRNPGRMIKRSVRGIM